MHEYGHTFQSQIWGPGYLFGIGIPSLISAVNSKRIPGTFLTTHRVKWLNVKQIDLLQDILGDTMESIGVCMIIFFQDKKFL